MRIEIISIIVFFSVFSLIYFLSGNFDNAIFLSIFLSLLPILINKVIENKIEKEKEEQFIRFSLNLAELLKAGIPLPYAIKEIEKVDYGILNPAIRRLAARIDWGIKIEDAFGLFAEELENKTIKRNIKTLMEIYKSGGDLGKSLEAIINTLLEIKRLKRSRESAVYENILHAYLVFLFFLGVVIVLETFLLPFLSESLGTNILGFSGESNINIKDVLFHLAIIQSVFAGLALGKMYDDSYKAGIKHILIFLIMIIIVFKVILPLIPKEIALLSLPTI